MRPGRAADHSTPSSAAVMEEQSYTSTHRLSHNGPVTGTPLFSQKVRSSIDWDVVQRSLEPGYRRFTRKHRPHLKEPNSLLRLHDLFSLPPSLSRPPTLYLFLSVILPCSHFSVFSLLHFSSGNTLTSSTPKSLFTCLMTGTRSVNRYIDVKVLLESNTARKNIG